MVQYEGHAVAGDVLGSGVKFKAYGVLLQALTGTEPATEEPTTERTTSVCSIACVTESKAQRIRIASTGPRVWTDPYGDISMHDGIWGNHPIASARLMPNTTEE